MQKINTELLKHVTTDAELEKTLKLYIDFLENPDDAIKHYITNDDAFDQLLKTTSRGLGGDYTRDKSVQIAINGIKSKLVNMLNSATDEAKKLRTEIRAGVAIMKTNKAVTDTTLDLEIIDKRVPLFNSDKVRAEYFDAKIDKITGLLKGDSDKNAKEFLNGLATLSKSLTSHDFTPQLLKENVSDNLLVVLKSRLKNNEIHMPLTIPVLTLKDEVSVPVTDIALKHTGDKYSPVEAITKTVENAKLIDTVLPKAITDFSVDKLENLLISYTTFINENTKKILESNLDNAALEQTIITFIYGLRNYQKLIKLLTVNTLNSAITLNTKIEQQSQIIVLLERITLNVIF